MISTTRLKALEAVAQAVREYRAALDSYSEAVLFSAIDRLKAALDELDALSQREKQIEEANDCLFGERG